MGTLYDPVESDLSSYNPHFVLSPELWRKFDISGIKVDFSQWDCAKMIGDDGKVNEEVNNIPTAFGGIYVYVICPPIIPEAGKYIMYIGKATKTETENLRARVRSYQSQFGDKYNRSKLHSLFTKWGDYVYVYYLPIDSSAEDITELEDRLIAAYGKPPCNKEVKIKSVKNAVDAVL